MNKDLKLICRNSCGIREKEPKNMNMIKQRNESTSTPGIQRCVQMLLSLLIMMQYCINHVESCADLTFWVIFLSFNHFRLVCYGLTDGPTDGRMDKASYRDAWKHLKVRENKANTHKSGTGHK